MLSKIFGFNKVERTADQVESQVNKYLEDKSLRLASISESSTKGKLYLTLFTAPGASGVKMKVFKDRDPKRIETAINEFLESKALKFSVQCSSTSNLTIAVFYSETGNNQNTTDSKPTEEPKAAQGNEGKPQEAKGGQDNKQTGKSNNDQKDKQSR